MTSPFKIVKIPRGPAGPLDDEDDPTLVRRYRAFRLNALRTDPDVFARSYEEESVEPEEYWRDRLGNPGGQHLIAVNTEPMRASQQVWQGIIVLLGPLPGDDEQTTPAADQSPWSKVPSVTFPHSSAQPHVRPKRLTFHLSFLYVAEGFRGRGIAPALIAEALARAEKYCRVRGVAEMQVGVHVDTFNKPATKVYQQAGLEIVAEENYPARTGGMPKVAYLLRLRKSIDV